MNLTGLSRAGEPLAAAFRKGLWVLLIAAAFGQLTGCQNVRDQINFDNKDDTKLVTAYLTPWRPGAPRLQIDLPKTSDVKMDTNSDATVYYISDKTKSDTMGIYVGGYPNLFSERRGVTKTELTGGVINGKSVIWISWKTTESPADLFHSETIAHGVFPSPEKPAGIETLAPAVHIFIIATSKKRAELYQRAAGTMMAEKVEKK